MRNPARQIAVLIILSLIVSACDAQDDSSGEDVQTIILHDDGNRVYDLHVPELVGTDPVPLLIALHGAGDSGPGMKRAAGLDKESDRRGFMVAYPSATGVNWAEGCDCVRPDIEGVDDVGFIDAMIEDIAVKRPLDRDRIYVIGYSQGGLFSQHLACERSDRLAGVATVAGSCPARWPSDVNLQAVRTSCSSTEKRMPSCPSKAFRPGSMPRSECMRHFSGGAKRSTVRSARSDSPMKWME